MKRTLVFLVFVIIILASCTKLKDDNKSIPTSSNLNGNIYKGSILDIFPLEEQFTWHYTGPIDYYRYETLVNMESIKEKEINLTVEGETEDLSGEGMRDLSFAKHYTVTEDKLSQIIGDNEIILLQKPLQEGNKWETIWYDIYGFFDVEITIDKVVENTITINIRTLDSKGIEEYKDFNFEIEFEKGKGIVRTFRNYFNNGEEPYPFEIKLDKTSKNPSPNFISRYVNATEEVKKVYIKDSSYYDIIVSEARGWSRKNINLTDKDYINKFTIIVNDFEENDIKLIGAAKEIALNFSYEMNNPDLIIYEFINFYENYIQYKLNYEVDELIDYNSKDYWEIFEDTESGSRKVKDLYKINNKTDKVKAQLFKSNGINIAFSEGWAYFTCDSGYLETCFSNISSDMMSEYIKLKEWFYSHEPIFNEGIVVVDLKEMIDQIVKIEAYVNKYKDNETSEKMLKNADFLFLILSVYNFDNTTNNMLTDDYKEAFEYFIDTYPKSEYGKHIKNIYSLLKKYGYMINCEVGKYLKELGYELEDFIYSDNLLQFEDFEKLKENKVNINYNIDNFDIVTVSNISELLEEIDSNKKIILKQELYQIPNNYQSDKVRIDSGELIINNVNNLIIQGEGDSPINIIGQSSGYVSKFINCNDIVLSNIRIGHMYEYCIAGVYYFEDCNNILLNDNIIFGCGEWGIKTNNVNNLKVYNTLISDCQSYALQIIDSNDVILDNCRITRNGLTIASINESKNISINATIIDNNYKDSYIFDDNEVMSLFKISNSKKVILNSCQVINNKAGRLGYYINSNKIIVR